MPAPYHVRLAISQYGEQFRAELFTEDLGDTEGDLLAELPPSLGEWVPYLAQGADLPPDAARQLGKDLFAALLGQPENAKKWSEILSQAQRKGQSIRLLIDATTEAVRDLPYGLMCEPHDDWFLFRGGKKQSVAFVRILRRCSPRPLKLGERLRVLLAVAEPRSADVPPFGAAVQLKALCEALRKDVEVILCGPDGPKPLAELFPGEIAVAALAPYTTTSRAMLRQALANTFDVFHLLAHGHGAGVLLCNEDGTPAETTASELGEWCSASRTALAFLQVCKAGQTANRGGFGGVAQQLLNPRGGNLAAVVASTFPLDAEHSTQAAVGFYRQLAAGRPPEEALTADRPETDWCWAFLELWARPGALGGTQQRAAFQFVSPYRGLSSFSEQDADLFFGRKAEVAELLHILRAEPAVAVVGDSGSGKTSLLQAGLAHAIRREGLAGSDRWKIAALRPGYRPAQALLAALTGAHAEPTPDLLQAALSTTAQPLLVVFDQFEEVFTLARDPAEVQMLTTTLAEAMETQRDRFRLILGMRSEFLGQAASVRGLSRLIRRPWVLRPPGTDDLRAIVAGPAEHCGYTFAPGLLDRILADPLLAPDGGGLTAAPLPLLQFALERLWLKAVEKGVTEFTHAEFDEIGGMGKAIAQHAEAVFQASATATDFGAQGRPLAEQIITALVSTQGTRQPRVREALQTETGHPDAARAVVDFLVGERLLTIRSDPEDITKSLVDLSHEALIQNWDRLRGWLADDPQGRAMREEFRTAAEKWEAGVAGVPPRSRKGLPGPDVATLFLQWIDTKKPKLSPAQQEFTAEMRAMLIRQRRRRRLVVTVLTALTLGAMVGAAVAFWQRGLAQAEERKARTNEERAKIETAALSLDTGFQLCEQGQMRFGLLAFIKALQICPTGAIDESADNDAKTAAHVAAKLRMVILTNLAGWGANVMCLDAARSFPGRRAIATDRDGRYLLMETPDSKVQLYSIDTGQPVGGAIEPLSVKDSEVMAAMLPDGKAVLYNQSHARVWNLTTGKSLGPEFIHGSQGPATLSPDARFVATGGVNGDVQLWNAVTGQAVGPPREHGRRIRALCFSPDSRHIVVGCGHDPAGEPGQVRYYSVDKPAALWDKFLTSPATAVAVSPDGKVVVGGGYNIRFWDSATGEQSGTAQNAESTAHIAFDSQHADQLLVCNPSGNLGTLDSQKTNPDVEQLSPQGWVVGTGFRADGRIFTANADGTVRLWHRPIRGFELRTFDPVKSNGILCVDFRPDGQAFALGGRDGFVYYYPSLDATKPIEFAASTDQAKIARGQFKTKVIDLKFSANGRRLLAQDIQLGNYVFERTAAAKFDCLALADDGRTSLQRHALQFTYNLRDIDTNAIIGKPFTLPGLWWPPIQTTEVDDEFLMRVKPADISRDHTRVAMLDREGRVHLIDPTTGQTVGSPLEHQIDGVRDAVRAVSFCTQSKHVLTRSQRARAVWSAETGKLIDLHANRIGVQVSRFSPNGTYILAGTNYNSGQVWDLTGKPMLPTPIMHESQLWNIAANADETALVTASYDRTARLWDVTTGKQLGPPMRHLLGVSDAVFSPDGTKILTGSWDGTAKLWPVPKPLVDDEPRITAWVETMMGLRTPAKGQVNNGVAVLMTADEWAAKKSELDRLGGPLLETRK